MNFRKATNALLESATLEDLAEAIGVSVQAVRQARTDDMSTAHRSPPSGWEKAVHDIAVRQMQHFASLARQMKRART